MKPKLLDIKKVLIILFHITIQSEF